MKLKTIFMGLVIAFVLFSIVTSPVQSAGMTKTGLVWVAGAVAQVFTFFGSLLHGAAG